MSTITFTATIVNGTIKIPEEYKQELERVHQVQVTVTRKKKISETNVMASLIKEPLQVTDSVALTGDELHERR